MTKVQEILCPKALKPTYEVGVIEGDRFIRFHPCGVVSFNKNDVKEHYCGKCHRFIEEEYAYAK